MGGGLDSSAGLGVILADPRQQQVGPVLQQQPVPGAGVRDNVACNGNARCGMQGVACNVGCIGNARCGMQCSMQCTVWHARQATQRDATRRNETKLGIDLVVSENDLVVS